MQNGPDTIAPGSVTINEPEKSTDLAVAWLPQNSTAVYAWRGSVDRKDWLANFHLMCASPAHSPSPEIGCMRLVGLASSLRSC